MLYYVGFRLRNTIACGPKPAGLNVRPTVVIRMSHGGRGDDCHNIDAWESEASFNTFGQERLGPAMAKVGVETVPEVTFHAAHEVFAPQIVALTSE